MPSISLSGNDSIVFNGTALTDFGDGDVMTITWGADISTTKVGKNGNVINARNAEGDLADVVLRLLRGSDDDIMLNQIESQYLQDPPSFDTPSMTATKRIGDGSGDVVNDTYALTFLMPKRHVDMKENVSGDTDQSLAIHTYTAVCTPSNSPRTIG